MKKLVGAMFMLMMFQGIAEELKKENLPIKLDLVRKTLDLDAYHKYQIKTFAETEGFGERRVVLMPKIIELVVDNVKYRLVDMKLLSITDRKKAVVWELPRKIDRALSLASTLDRSMIKDGHMKKREILESEFQDMNKLREGERWVLHKDQRDLKIVAPLHGGPKCIRCHEDYNEGEFMGAFIYDLTVVDKVPYKNKEDKPVSKKKISELSQKK